MNTRTAMGSKRAWILGLLAMVALGCAQRVHAFGKGDKGSSSAQFLKIGPGARASGMAEAFSGAADDAYAAYYNPAGLGFLKRPEAGGMHDAHFQGVNYEYAVVAVPVLSWIQTKRERNAFGVMAFSITNLSVGSVERRGATETDDPAGTFSANDLAYALSYAYAFEGLNLSLGATVKYVDSNIDSIQAGSVAGDLGVLWRSRRFSFGTGLRHLGEGQQFGRVVDNLPLTAYAGLGVRPLEGVLLSFDAAAANDAQPRLAWGAEYRHPFTQQLSGSLRAGYASHGSRNASSGGLTGGAFGAGVGYGNFDFDFAFVPFGELGNSFRFSLHAKF